MLVGRVLLGRGAAVRALLATCAPSPCASKVRRNPRRSLFGGWALPERNVFGGGIDRKIRAGRSTVIFCGSGGPESAYASQSAPSERMGSFGTEPQQAIVSWFCLLIARSCVHVICVFWRWLKTWKIERSSRVLKRKLRATHRERRRVPRKTGDGACRDSGGGTVRVERIGSDGKSEAFSFFRARRSCGKVKV